MRGGLGILAAGGRDDGVVVRRCRCGGGEVVVVEV